MISHLTPFSETTKPHFMKRIYLLGLAVLLSAHLAAQTTQTLHTVQGGETFYSISRQYGISIDDLKQANPQTTDILLAGSTLVIPTPKEAPQNVYKELYKVQKKETIYSISRKFNITESELRAANPEIAGKNNIKKGDVLRIPYSQQELEAQRLEQERIEAERRAAEEQRRAEELAAQKAIRKQRGLNVAVILPFSLSSEYKSKEAIKLIDFYEGFLLGVANMKTRGHNVNVYAYEDKSITTASIDSILQLPQMAEMNLVVGPTDIWHLERVNDFCREHNICMAIPFSSRNDLLVNHPTSFQINRPIAELYTEVYRLFAEQTPRDAQICFVQCHDKNDKINFVNGLKQMLEADGRTYRDVEIADLEDFPAVLASANGQQTVLIPTAATPAAFDQIVQTIEKNVDYASYRYRMFGHPEWLTFNEKNQASLARHHASFYTNFYTYRGSTAVNNFTSQFQHWFKRETSKTNPNYGYLGYDVARFFIHGLLELGDEFYTSPNDVALEPLQTPMQFQRSKDGSGFVNTHVKIINL